MLSVLLGLAAEVLAPSCCAACSVRVPAGRAFCPPCASSVEPLAGDPSCVAVARYGGALARAVTRFKYEGAMDAGRVLGRLVAQKGASLAGVDVVVPVPLHPNRLAQRGFNQAALLARPLARALRQELAPCALVRVKDTERQVGLPKRARLANVADAFAVGSPRLVRGKSVVLVDDVLTSGATLAACAHALLGGGAERVRAVVVARATEADFSPL